MDNQHKFINGYRDLNRNEIQAMNDVKALGNSLGNFLVNLSGNKDIEVDERWLSIGITEIQKGLMSAVRAIAQPTTF